jgi:maltose O-acetyltransferase
MENKMWRCLRYDWPLHFVLLLTNWLPDNVLFLRLRGKMARLFLGSCGANLRLGRNLTFYNPSKIRLGCDVYVAQGTWFMAGEKIEVGDKVLFGPYCVIVSSNHSRVDGSFRIGSVQRKQIKIGRGAWLGAHVTVVAGTVIGNGSQIGANSVVRGTIPADHLAAGHPAKLLKQLEEQ